MDSFKGTMTAAQACEAAERGLRSLWPHARMKTLPLADGGGGTVEAILRARGGAFQTTAARGPLGSIVAARWGMLADKRTAVVEMAAASGLALVAPGERDPMRASSHGTGEVLRATIASGARRILLGIGDTATVDGGLGAAQALGVRFFDDANREITQALAGADLERVASADVSALRTLLADVEIEVLCDVSNPLLGGSGAARVFGPQKGASPGDVERLENGLRRAYDVIEQATGTSVRALPGAGAAGGMGAAAVALLGARLVPGTERIFKLIGFAEALRSADILLTGEGRIDAQSLSGKGAGHALLEAHRAGVRAWAISGLAPEGVDPRATLHIERLAVLATDTTCPEPEEAQRQLEQAAARLASQPGDAGAYPATSNDSKQR
ncbi:MAG: glycerate 2-kinase [Candidatus Sumerlaeota bacterium]|nr:glycerate 2-kinase [Candidatus Sumerlaeota bacterium]